MYYESLTGHAPFYAKGIIALLRAIIDEEEMPLRKCRPDLPSLADTITSRALASRTPNGTSSMRRPQARKRAFGASAAVVFLRRVGF